ncbi:Peroxisomal membrane protein PEX21 [Kluyveromyces marxianus]
MSVCQTNPLNTLVSKSGYRFGAPQDLQPGQSRQDGRVSQLDRQFVGFTQDSMAVGAAAVGAPSVVPVGSRAGASGPGPQSQNQGHAGGPDAAWIDQFAKMQVRDRAAFSDEYKRMYSQYESRGVSRDPLAQASRFANLNNSSNMNMNVSMAVPRPLAAATAQHLDEQLEDQLEDQLDEQLEAQFAEIERQEQQQQQQQQQQQLALDQDQLQLKEAAQSIYTTLSSNSTPNNAKFSNSKFLGLMRNISDGVVTIKKDREQDKYTELYSPSTGETFGEEYFPIQDDVTSDPLHSIDDLSNMSSSEAAAHVFRDAV